MSVTKVGPVDLALLHTELASAGFPYAVLGKTGDVLHTYDGAGRALDLDPATQPIVDAHDYQQGATYQNAQEDRESLLSYPPRSQVKARIAQIDADLATLAGLAQSQQVQILTRTLQNQRFLVRNLSVFVYATPAGQGQVEPLP